MLSRVPRFVGLCLLGTSLVATTSACSKTDSTIGPDIVAVHARSNVVQLIVTDPCFTDMTYNCIQSPADIHFTFPDITLGGSGAAEDLSCPVGCTTFPLRGNRLFEFKKALARIDSINGPNCGWVSGFLTQLQSAGRIRSYISFDGHDGWAVWTPGTGPDYTAHIYLHARLAETDLQNNANTLAHEAWHAWNRKDDTGNLAAIFAQGCAPI